MRLVPEARFENFGDVGEQRVGVGMADAFGARRGEQDEGVAIGELVALARAVVVERPEIAAVLGVAMALADRLHAVIDDVGGAGPAEQMGDGEAMDHARRLVQRPHAVAGQRPAARVEIGEAAGRIDQIRLVKRQQRIGLVGEPAAVGGAGAPEGGVRRSESASATSQRR